MTQHTDMGGLVERLRKYAVAFDMTIGPHVAKTMNEAADAIEALSIPQGLGEKK